MKAADRVACAVVVVIAVCFVSLMSAQSPGAPNSVTCKPLVLYDDFNGQRIDPAKWDDWTASERMFEVVRELSPQYQGQGNNRRLHMLHRTYSETFDDYDANYGWIGLPTTNPSSIVDISFEVTVNSATASGCQSNPLGSGAWAGFVGRYFNYGGQQDSSQDAEAQIALHRSSDDTGTPLSVYASVNAADVNTMQFLGLVSLGKTAKLRLKWDQPNHHFTFQLNTNPAVMIGYGVPDTSPPAIPLKAFWVAGGTPHCTTTPIASEAMDAYFDNVYVNAQ